MAPLGFHAQGEAPLFFRLDGVLLPAQALEMAELAAVGKGRCPPSKPGMATARGHKLESTLERLSELLRRLSRQKRQAVLTDLLLQWQRLELENWLLGNQAAASCSKACGPPRPSAEAAAREATAAGSRAAPGGTPIPSLKRRSSQRTGPWDKRQRLRKCQGAGFHPGGSARSSLQRGSEQSADAQEPQTGGISTWNEPGGRVWYTAAATLGGLRIRAWAVQDRGMALKLLQVLRSARCQLDVQRLSSGPKGDASESSAESMEQALLQALKEEGLDPKHFQRFRYKVTIPARLWLGHALATPWISDLAVARAALDQLREARGRTNPGERVDLSHDPHQEEKWEAMLVSYLLVCSQAGCDPAARIEELRAARERRRAAAEDRHRRRTQRLERWNMLRMAQEERRQRRVELLQQKLEERNRRLSRQAALAAARKASQERKAEARIERQIVHLATRWRRCEELRAKRAEARLLQQRAKVCRKRQPGTLLM